jgi:uncharacterized protein (DUF2147 family)
MSVTWGDDWGIIIIATGGKQKKNKHMKPKFFLSIFTLAAFSVVLFSFKPTQNDADAIIGSWKNGEGTGIIQINKNGDKYQGKIIWLKEPNDPKTGQPKTDNKHPDEKNHTRPLIGLVNMWGFKYVGSQEWNGGKIYDPKNGKTYSCKIIMENNSTLKVRGYIGVSLIGRTDTWTRQ